MKTVQDCLKIVVYHHFHAICHHLKGVLIFASDIALYLRQGVIVVETIMYNKTNEFF